MRKPRLLVTGAGGFCGEHACTYFASRGYDVIGTLRAKPAGASAASSIEGITYTYCDLNVRQEVERLIEQTRPAYILHFAGMNAVGPSWIDPASALESNLFGTIRLMEAVRSVMAQGEACRIIVAGSMLRFPLPAAGERPLPPHPYSFSKTMQVLAARSWATLYGMDVIVAEPSNLIGPGRSKGITALMARYAAEVELRQEQGSLLPPPLRLSSRSEQRDLLDVRDAIRAYEVVMENGVSGEVYPMASGVMVTLGELADQVTALASCALAWEVGQSNAPSPSSADTSKLAKLGWRPSIPLAQSLADTLDHMRQSVRTAKAD